MDWFGRTSVGFYSTFRREYMRKRQWRDERFWPACCIPRPTLLCHNGTATAPKHIAVTSMANSTLSRCVQYRGRLWAKLRETRSSAYFPGCYFFDSKNNRKLSRSCEFSLASFRPFEKGRGTKKKYRHFALCFSQWPQTHIQDRKRGGCERLVA